jgi:beta-glucosidase
LVLLKNDPLPGTAPVSRTLPLKKSVTIHLIGGHANNMALQCGGWTMGNPTGATQTAPAGTTIKAAFDSVAKANNGTVTYASDGNVIPPTADVVVVVIGEQVYTEGGGDVAAGQPIDFDADARFASQRALVAAAKGSGKPVVVILVSGRPLIITAAIANVDAWACAWLPGTEGAGITDVLYGDKDFTGTLSHTWPKSYGQIPINHDNPATGQPYGDAVGTGGVPLFAYHFGLRADGTQLP